MISSGDVPRTERTLAVAFLASLVLSACGMPDRRVQPPDAAQSARRSHDESSGAATDHLVSATAMGGVQLGDSLAAVRRKFPAARFARTSDGDGVALVALTLAPDAELIVYAGEEDPDSAIDWASRVRMIETLSARFATNEGVRAGSLVADVESLYGPVREVMLSEIESRQYVTFERQPPYLTFRLDYSGVFPDGASTTKVVAPGGRIHSIAISTPD